MRQNGILSANDHRTKAGVDLSAQYAILCSLVLGSPASISAPGAVRLIKTVKRADVVLCVALQLFYNLRISEVLSIRHDHIDSSGRLYVQCLKGSSKIVINDISLSGILLYYKVNCIDPFIDLDRFFMYRLYKQYGISNYNSGNGNNAVTHAFRHKAAKEVRIHSKLDSDVTTVLNHRSSKSQAYYGKK